MDEGFEEKINAILSNPEQMAGIAQMAQQILGQSGGDHTARDAAETAPAQESGGMMSLLGKLMGGAGGGKNSKSEALLLAMQPYLRPERREKIQRAMKISRMLNLASTVMKDKGGDSHGL